ncbi:MAG: spore germination protein [Christensenellales bacterium]
MKIFKQLQKNVDYIKEKLNNNKDLIERYLTFNKSKVCVMYLNEQADQEKLNEHIIKSLIDAKPKIKATKDIKNAISIAETQDVEMLDDCIDEILNGNAIVLVDKLTTALKCAVTKVEQRTVVEPPTSAVIFGPREGFIESINVNKNLIRKRLPTTSLKFKEIKVGKYTKTKIVLCYLKDIADNEVVNKIEKRINQINIDGIVDSHYLISFLEEKQGSMFKQIGKTEKPDIAVAKMLEGRVAIIVDGSPIVLTLPFVILEDLQNSDDYYQRHNRISVVRILRVISVLLSILLPGTYVAIQLYHYRVIPLKFLVSIINSTQGIPFTPFLEMLFVILLFEILFEASLRMPKYLGIAVSIVGALVLGDTAVKAGLISSPAVMIIAVTGISFYTLPEETSQLSILRMIFTLLGGTFGLLGLVIGGLILINYLVDFNGYGAPYLAPYAPYIKTDLKDALFKKEVSGIDTRPKSIPNKNRIRKR